MLVKDPKYRKRLRKSQLELLIIIFKFRFVSSEYVASWLNKDKSTIYERLLVLERQGYIRKDYDPTYRLRLRPAAYSLTAKGIRYLRGSNAEVHETALRNMYKNKSASLQLVDHSLNVFKLYLLLKQQYPGTFEILTRSELSAFSDFLRPLPDLYLDRGTEQGYQLEIIEAGTYIWIVKKRIKAHEGFCTGNGDWSDGYPSLLLVCDNAATEKRIQKVASRGNFPFGIYTATRERLAAHDPDVWLTDYDADWDDKMEFIRL